MLPPDLKTAREVRSYYDTVYEQLIASGEYQPFLYPWATLGFGIVLIYLLIDHRTSPTLRSLRPPLYGFLCAFAIWCITTNKARSAAASYGVGLISAWGTLWTGAIMFFNDCQDDFQRIERLETTEEPVSNGSVDSSRPQARKRPSKGSAHKEGPLYWQSYPANSFKDRLDWVFDVFCNFRGVGWNFQTHGIPPLPVWAQEDLSRANTDTNPTSISDQSIEGSELVVSKTGIRRYTSHEALLRHCIPTLIYGFFALDLIKLLMHADPYFWGYTTTPLLPPWLPSSSPIIVKSVRLLLSLAGIYTALLEIFTLGPVFFAFLHWLAPSLVSLRGESWMNPPDFYGDFSAVLDKGLAGWWGSWWHQTFRFAFEAPATALLAHYKIPKSSPKGKLLSLWIAFFLSGCLHASGSYTQLGTTRPLRGPMLFFLLQPLGILFQTYLPTKLLPKPLLRIYNLFFVGVWMYWTAPLLVDDFAKGGIWLYEPLAFSPLRILGLGANDENGWDLWYGLVFWRRGKTWWDTGIGF